MAHILVIDDEKNIRNMVRLALSQSGHQAETAESGDAGLERFGSGENWDMVLLDQRMPGSTGSAVVPEIIKRDPTARVVMMSAFATVELASEVIRAGVKDFLRKPFTADTLRAATEKALSRPKKQTQSLAPHIEDEVSTQPPQITYFVNGFDFWSTLDESPWPAGIEIGRAFLVRDMQMQVSRCLVGITPHVKGLITETMNLDIPENSTIWTSVCGLGLSEYLWQKSHFPPAVLPIFELTTGQIDTIRLITDTDPYLEI